jgi:hypothetical protein
VSDFRLDSAAKGYGLTSGFFCGHVTRVTNRNIRLLVSILYSRRRL